MFSPPWVVEEWEKTDFNKFWLALGAASAVVQKTQKVSEWGVAFKWA